jgi:polyhydroxyalkanoate synthesis regulator phasin
LSDVIEQLHEDNEITDARLYALTSKLDNKEYFFSNEVEGVEGTIGNRIINDSSNYQTPTLWGSVAALATGIDALDNSYNTLSSTLLNDIKHSAREIRNYVDESVQEMKRSMAVSVQKSNDRIDHLTNESRIQDQTILSVVRGSFKLKDDLVSLNQLLVDHTADRFVHRSGSDREASPNPNLLPAKIDEVLERMNQLSQQVMQIRADHDGESVKFFGLGFREPREAEAWAAAHLSGISYGTVVDAHLVLEHVNSNLSDSEGTLKELQGLYKLKIENITQGRAIASFESRVPKLFSKHSTLIGTMVSKTGKSYFDQVPSYADWDEANTGFRERLKFELRNFEYTHTRVIEDKLDPDSKAYNIAKLSVTSSVTWILQLAGYMDDTYKDLNRHNAFSPDYHHD